MSTLHAEREVIVPAEYLDDARSFSDGNIDAMLDVLNDVTNVVTYWYGPNEDRIPELVEAEAYPDGTY